MPASLIGLANLICSLEASRKSRVMRAKTGNIRHPNSTQPRPLLQHLATGFPLPLPKLMNPKPADRSQLGPIQRDVQDGQAMFIGNFQGPLVGRSSSPITRRALARRRELVELECRSIWAASQMEHHKQPFDRIHTKATRALVCVLLERSIRPSRG